MAEVDDSPVLSRLRGFGTDADQSLLVLLALGRLATTGNRDMPWSVAEIAFADMASRFGPAQAAQGDTEVIAARAFLGLSHDHFWALDAEVPDDRPRALNERRVSARLDPVLEQALRGSPGLSSRGGTAPRPSAWTRATAWPPARLTTSRSTRACSPWPTT
jgi:hypothetical protein